MALFGEEFAQCRDILHKAVDIDAAQGRLGAVEADEALRDRHGIEFPDPSVRQAALEPRATCYCSLSKNRSRSRFRIRRPTPLSILSLELPWAIVVPWSDVMCLTANFLESNLRRGFPVGTRKKYRLIVWRAGRVAMGAPPCPCRVVAFPRIPLLSE